MKYIFKPVYIANHLELNVLPLIDNAYLADTIAQATDRYNKNVVWYNSEHWLVKLMFGCKPSPVDVEKLRQEHVNYQSAVQGWIKMFYASKANYVSLNYTELCRYKLDKE